MADEGFSGCWNLCFQVIAFAGFFFGCTNILKHIRIFEQFKHQWS